MWSEMAVSVFHRRNSLPNTIMATHDELRVVEPIVAKPQEQIHAEDNWESDQSRESSYLAGTSRPTCPERMETARKTT